MAVELAEVEEARENVEQGLAKSEALDAAEVDELVRNAAQLGWRLAKLGPDATPDVVVDRSGEKPVVRSFVVEAYRGALLGAFRESLRP